MEDRTVRTASPPPRLVVVLDGQRWYIRHRGAFHRVDHDEGLALADWLPLDVVDVEPPDAGPAEVDHFDDRIEIRASNAGEVVTVTVTATPVELLTEVVLDPDPTPDGWVPTGLSVVVAGVETLTLHFYLPDGARPPTKRCTVTSDGRLLVDSQLDRGAESEIHVIVPDQPGPVDLRVEFDRPEELGAEDERQLGAVLSGISRTIRRADA